MTSEELRARLLRNAQRTDAAKAGVRCSVAFLACCCLSLGHNRTSEIRTRRSAAHFRVALPLSRDGATLSDPQRQTASPPSTQAHGGRATCGRTGGRRGEGRQGPAGSRRRRRRGPQNPPHPMPSLATPPSWGPATAMATCRGQKQQQTPAAASPWQTQRGGRCGGMATTPRRLPGEPLSSRPAPLASRRRPKSPSGSSSTWSGASACASSAPTPS